jgi:dephospho-CoA kinase
MHVFGLTGGIATGKSTVAARWGQRGLPVVDADDLARLVVSPGSEGLKEVVRLFGTDVLLDDGSLNRAFVAAKVFSDVGVRRSLESITHPRIRSALQSRLQQLQTECFPIACYEAPLLIEVGCQDSYRPLVVVSATEELQLIRAQQRDSSQETALRARIAAQLPLATKAAAADYVIQNTGSRQALIREADRVLDAVCRRVGVNPSALKPT